MPTLIYNKGQCRNSPALRLGLLPVQLPTIAENLYFSTEEMDPVTILKFSPSKLQSRSRGRFVFCSYRPTSAARGGL